MPIDSKAVNKLMPDGSWRIEIRNSWWPQKASFNLQLIEYAYKGTAGFHVHREAWGNTLEEAFENLLKAEPK
jgi:hypothetical protein